MKRRTAVLFVAAALAAPGLTFGQEGPPAASGFTGRFEAGVGYASSTDQLETAGENERTESLGENADRYDRFLPLVLFDLRYTFGASGTEVFLGTPLEGGGPPGLTLGAVQPWEGVGRLGVSVFWRPFGDVWEDPYLEQEDRDETRVHVYGAKLSCDGILGTPWSASYTWEREDVEDDEIGARAGDLERDGSMHRFQAKYAIELGPGTALEPEIGYTLGDYEGRANRFDALGAGLSFRRFRQGYGVILSASMERAEFDAEHPVFRRTREEVEVSAFLLVVLPNLFGQERLFSDVLLGFSHREANIDFFDADTLLTGLTLGVRL